jgi:3'-5' exoribonuclease
MATASVPRLKVPELTSLEVGHDALCFAALANRQEKTAKTGSPYLICTFKDRHGKKDFFVWSNEPAFQDASNWATGEAYRLRVRAKSSQRGVELSLLDGRLVQPELDAAEGFELADLYEVSKYPQEECFQAVRGLAEKHIAEAPLRELVLRILDEHKDELKRMPAASAMHHAFTGGLIEHLRSMTRVSLLLAQHYEIYYRELDPPVNVGIVLAAAILHDIGKLVELRYNPISATYTTEGRLIGHILIGRDLVRRVAAEIPDFPPQTLIELEHAILAHHGRQEYGSPVVPQTIEAYIVSVADDLDAKVNQIVKARMAARTGDEFTEDVSFSNDRRRFYRGVPRHTTTESNPPPSDDNGN